MPTATALPEPDSCLATALQGSWLDETPEHNRAEQPTLCRPPWLPARCRGWVV